MSARKRFIALAVTGAVAGSGLIATTAGTAGAVTRGDVVAQSCYGSADDYTKASGTQIYPNYPTFFYLKTSSNCADINIKTDTNRYVKVCFLTSGGGTSCQTDYKLATAGNWRVIATNVKDGTEFQFHFRSDAKSTGHWAA
ncbi:MULTISPECIES: hypothetical protein [unclassified Streptomyces]|uniref:hypothetical protein n=1 Tax=unclassified Streptomyces TaxID=2593676 RepID=UPI002366D549|nr:MULTISPECIES: hypothetical protein [unclassified Streptomyces]MDF3147075.1 hypothetical protein [Streptomyces sp. T21Q-yed]WDF40702.1 hypothetical protein PBV52_29925 [Streptomyces sp. T12]